MSDTTPTLTVAVCTRGRPDKLRATLAALEGESAAGFELLVIDQGDEPDPGLERRAAGSNGRMRVLTDPGRGLSRARNIALRESAGDWLCFVDDDCVVAPGFGAALIAEIAAHPRADWVSGNVEGRRPEEDGMPVVATFPVDRLRERSGRFTLPGSIGFGALFAVRRSTAQRLEGWDERLGPGVPELPAADDMDFNYRLLRSGGVAVISPRVRAVHEQWRTPAELVSLQQGYLRAWSAFAIKHLRSGDPLGGAWLWAWGAIDVLDMAKSALGRRSRLRARLALAKLRGLLEGTAAGVRRSW